MAGRAYDDERGAAEWPFRARCVAAHAACPLQVGEVVDVSRMALEDACLTDMIVLVRWMQRPLGVPLRLLEPVGAADQTRQAVEDWRYWLDRGYQL